MNSPLARVSVCTLTSRHLVPPLSGLPQAAIVGTLMTSNLGIEGIVRGLLDQPTVTSLLVCGRDSPKFRPGQSLVSLFRRGVDEATGVIVGADGYLPLLQTVTPADVDRLRAQVHLVDARGLQNLELLGRLIARAADRWPSPIDGDARTIPSTREGLRFERLSPGGRRDGLHQRNEGFVVINVDREAHQIKVQTFEADLSPRYEMAGRRAESMILGLLRAGVVSELSHAGYLGAELAKAESALRLGLPYEQDLPLRATTPDATTGEETP